MGVTRDGKGGDQSRGPITRRGWTGAGALCRLICASRALPHRSCALQRAIRERSVILSRFLCCLLEGVTKLIQVEGAATVLVPAVEESVGLSRARVQVERAQVVAELTLEELAARKQANARVNAS